MTPEFVVAGEKGEEGDDEDGDGERREGNDSMAMARSGTASATGFVRLLPPLPASSSALLTLSCRSCAPSLVHRYSRSASTSAGEAAAEEEEEEDAPFPPIFAAAADEGVGASARSTQWRGLSAAPVALLKNARTFLAGREKRRLVEARRWKKRREAWR